MILTNSFGTLRRSLLIKVISRPTPSRADIASVIELIATKVVEALQAQSMTFYLVEGDQISFRQVYYSPTLWEDEPAKEKYFRESTEDLLKRKIALGRGVVGQVIETGKPFFYRDVVKSAELTELEKNTGFRIQSTLTVPLKTTLTLGAIQVLNKEPSAGTNSNFTDEDLLLLQEVAEYSSTLIHRMVDPKFVPSAEDAARFVARLTELPLVTKTDDIEIDRELVESIGDAVIRSEGVFPHQRLAPGSVAVLMANPLDYTRREAFTRSTGITIDEVSVISATMFEDLLRRYFVRDKGGLVALENVNIDAMADIVSTRFNVEKENPLWTGELESGTSAPLIQLTNRIIEDAYICGASDIHIDPADKDLSIRYRIDGYCQDKLRLPKEVAGPLVARLKIMSNLDIAERRLPQDGRIIFKKYTNRDIDIDLRVATVPTNHGEKVVLRILDKEKSALPLTALGFSAENLAKYLECIRQPHGMILHCGPTGSGKSMTLYSALGEINTRDVNIQTAEDPIEYTLPGLNQTQMNRQIGLTFARALRTYLRMDPDVILVGEIRDRETAQVAIEAALTGHLLVSTLHTNDAASTIARFGEMGIEPFQISGSLICVCAQRLVRRLCRSCRTPHQPHGREKAILENALGWSGDIYKANPRGCLTCGGAGYKGRIGIHELMVPREVVAEAINQKVDAQTLKRVAMCYGMKSLHQDSMLKVKQGIVSFDEAIASVPPDLSA